jgi:hypothetical protein
VSLTFHDELEDFDFKVNEGVSQLFIQFNSWELPEHNEQLPVVPKSINLYVPKDEKGVTKDFSELASKNRKYLCMLKGDIDLMSIILKHGFETTYSVSRLVQFSRMLELFFGCYLNNFLKSKFENVYTVYSGGDDFVFIVPFVDRFTFISALYKKFGSFVAGNEKVHFSVGLSIFKDKTPFSAVEQQTEELLKAAKKKAKSVLEDIKEGEREKLECRGIVVYDKDFTFSFLTTEEITNLEKKSTLEWPMGEGGITDTMLYTMYETLSEMLQEFKKGNVAKYLHLGARVLYMLQKNLKEEYREIIINDIKSIISEIPLKNDEFYTEKLQNILYKIVNLMYANRA